MHYSLYFIYVRELKYYIRPNSSKFNYLLKIFEAILRRNDTNCIMRILCGIEVFEFEPLKSIAETRFSLIKFSLNFSVFCLDFFKKVCCQMHALVFYFFLKYFI